MRKMLGSLSLTYAIMSADTQVERMEAEDARRREEVLLEV
jgi:hypothetical protein